MVIIKCKMCGGDIQPSTDQNYGTCDFCGSVMTLPKTSDERRINLFNRANHFRRLNDFDKALNAYENILKEDLELKDKIHPQFYQATITCACGNSFVSGSTKKALKVDVCSKCHPYFTGVQKIVDTTGRLERFTKKLGLDKKEL